MTDEEFDERPQDIIDDLEDDLAYALNRIEIMEEHDDVAYAAYEMINAMDRGWGTRDEERKLRALLRRAGYSVEVMK